MLICGMLHLFCLLLLSSTFSTSNSLADHANHDKNGQELLLCRKCGTDVADSFYIFSKSSPGAQKTEKQNLFGRQNITVQTLVNPFGVKFDLVTIEKTRCKVVGPPQGADSWFPGYTWRICACPHCGQHLGWVFESSNRDTSEDDIQSFHGLILSNILGENFTDSLIMMPNTFKL